MGREIELFDQGLPCAATDVARMLLPCTNDMYEVDVLFSAGGRTLHARLIFTWDASFFDSPDHVIRAWLAVAGRVLPHRVDTATEGC